MPDPFGPNALQQQPLAKVPPPQIPVAAGASPQVQQTPPLARSIGGSMAPQGSVAQSIGQAKPLATAQPSQPAQPSLGPEGQEAARLRGSKPGAEQIHNPFLRTLATVGDALASTVTPHLASFIPGTTAHHNVLMGNAEAGAKEEQAAKTAGTEAKLKEAQTRHANAQADTLENPQDKPITNEMELFLKDPQQFARYRELVTRAQASGKPEFVRDGAGNIVGFVDPKGMPHSANDPGLDPQAKAIMDAAQPKQPSLPEGERPLQNTDNLNKALESRFQVLNPGKPLPEQFKIPPNSTQKDYDRVDKALEGLERAAGTKAQQDQIAEMRRQTMAIAAGNAARAEERPGRGLLDKAENTYRQAQQSATDLRNFISMAQAGNKVTAQAIPLEGTLAIVTSQGVKRINRTEVENNQAAGSLFDNIMGRVGKMTAGQPVPPDLLKDWARLADMMEKTSYDSYKGAFDSAKKRYHLNDEEPLPAPHNTGGAPQGSGAGWSVKVVK